jgi:hypothetical protein
VLKRESADLVYHLGHTASPPTHLEDSSQVTVSALLVSANRHDAALEQIIGRMSLEPVRHGRALAG